MVARMSTQVVDLINDRRPQVVAFLFRVNGSLGGRLASLTLVFALALLLALWQGARPLPPSAWQELGLLSDSPALRLVAQRDAVALQDLFDERGYTLAGLSGGAAVPRLAVARLPRDIDDLTDSVDRKALFLRSLLPLVLQANSEIARIRGKVAAALDARAAGRLGAVDSLWLEQVAAWYGADPENAADILRRIDQVPPSLALAQAAQESGWGRSRFARDANALFGQRTWGEGQPGLAPKDADQDNFRVRAFPDLMSGVRAYLHNLNSHRAYEDLRERRARARAVGTAASSLDLAGSLTSYSEEGAAYVAALRELITSNDLRTLDGLRLERLRGS